MNDPFMNTQLCDMEMLDTRMYNIPNVDFTDPNIKITKRTQENSTKNGICFSEDILEEENKKKKANIIIGSYNKDYDILSIDDLIKDNLQKESGEHLNKIKNSILTLKSMMDAPQNYITRKKTIDSIAILEEEKKNIENGEKYKAYIDATKDIIDAYKKQKRIKTWVFTSNADTDNDTNNKTDEESNKRILYIEQFLDVAKKYIAIDIIRTNDNKNHICSGCGTSLAEVSQCLDGTILCPNEQCSTEHEFFSLSKSNKDATRIYNINSNMDDDSIENFMRAFIRYLGGQSDHIDPSIYEKLDAYFEREGYPKREDILTLPLNSRGKRGDTNNLTLYGALTDIKYSEYIEHCNLIGSIYWGWSLPNVMQYKNKIIDHYNITQKVFYQIPIEERERVSSLGTQFRLWRHLQLVGHECQMDDFKIAEDPDSLRIHNKLWKLMCEGAKHEEIYYIS
jgi:hypothetical protein